MEAVPALRNALDDVYIEFETYLAEYLDKRGSVAVMAKSVLREVATELEKDLAGLVDVAGKRGPIE